MLFSLLGPRKNFSEKQGCLKSRCNRETMIILWSDHNHQSKTAPSQGRFMTPPCTNTQKKQEGKLGQCPCLLGQRRWREWGWGILIVDEDEEWGKRVSGAEAATEEIYSHKFAAAPGPRAASFPSSPSEGHPCTIICKLWSTSTKCCSGQLWIWPRAQEQQASPPHMWGSSLYHLLTCCSVNLSSSPRPRTSELRGSS